MKIKTLKEFIKENATPKDNCHYYNEYSKKEQEMLANLYSACWRFNLQRPQIIFMLNEALKPFGKDELEIL